MKKLTLILVLTLGFAFSADAGCFENAREWVIQTEGSVNLENVGFLIELTAYFEATGLC
ncbi:hypothetical protein GGR32_000745 [Mesonia hippocampi]|uniref:Uncharacterized protein n=1 Tax=Mesonia hippocampi TaxID=1628250 RepID=A0A840EN23_9FLAO|nr:hypothetical protein [Mesonia hippocampi]MBB4118471.1 hypothetical protein [Mesonia hippocampi]